MNIIFLTLIEITDINDRGIYHDLLRKFRDEGHNVFVINPVERRKKLRSSITKQDGVSLLSVHTLNIQKTNIIEKGIGTLLLERQFLKEFKNNFSKIKFDLILYSTPPVTLTKVIKYIKQKDKAFSYLLLKDIFPQNAVDLGIIKKNGILHKFFSKKEQELYQYSDFIGCMSPGNVDYILKHNPEVNTNKIEVNPNSISPNFTELSLEEKHRLREEYQIPKNATVFIYGGNIGKPQGINFLITVLDSQKNKTDLFFILAGGGTEFKIIDDWFKNNKPKNALLINSLPKMKYDELLKVADVGLIFLDKRFTIPNFPSRLLSYLENKMPVIAATDKKTDLGHIIKHAGCGFWCESGDLESFNKILQYFVNNKSKISKMGDISYELLMNNYTVQVSYDAIINKVEKADFKQIK